MNTEKHIRIAVILIITAVGIGALAVHLLKEILSVNELNSLNTGVRYQLFHGLALLILALNAEKFNSHIKKSINIMITGTCLFSFSIYLLSIQKSINVSMSFLGPITPIGGVLLITSWMILFLSIKKID
jgi:uncharacterized membrane protein YgdD (TMEM256/DUF423 family)